MRHARRLALLVLSVAAVLRAYGLASWPIDGDELYSWYDVQTLLAGEPFAAGVKLFPLGYLLMAASVPLLGLSELSLRLLPALLSLGAVGVLLNMRPRELSQAQRLVAALLAAISPWLLFHGQSARFYGPLLFFAALSLSWSWPGPGRRPRLAWAAWLAATLCHPSALLALPALIFAEGDRAACLRRLGGLALLGLLGAAVFAFTDDTPLHDVLRWSFGGADPGHYGLVAFVLGFAYNLGPLVGLLALAGLLGAWRSGEPGARLLGLWGLAPPALLLAAGALGVSVHQRYAMVAVPALLLLAALGWRRLPSGPARGLALLLLVLIPAPRVAAHLQDGSRHDPRAVAAYLGAHASPEDHILLEEHATIELYLHAQPGFADIETIEAPIGPKKRHSLARSWRDAWVALKTSRLDRPQDREFNRWTAEVFDEVTRIGRAPSSLERHDNRYVIYRRRRRLKPGPYVPPVTPDPSAPAGQERR